MLLTEPAFALLGAQLPGHFEEHLKTYEGFGQVPVRVRFLGQALLDARDAVYKLSKVELELAAASYMDVIKQFWLPAALQQMRAPIRPFGWVDRLLMAWDGVFG